MNHSRRLGLALLTALAAAPLLTNSLLGQEGQGRNPDPKESPQPAGEEPLNSTSALPTPKGQPKNSQDPPQAAALKGKNLILITLDTTRADHITCLGGPKGLTPHLDALAKEGALFTHCYSQTNVTNPSHTAILTGLYAIDTMVMNNIHPFDEVAKGVDTLPAAFKRAGYRTAGFPATPHLSASALNIPGFDDYYPMAGGLEGNQIVDRVIEWLDVNGSKPFFAWVHFFDPHMPYEAPQEYRDKYYPADKDPKAGSDPRFGEDENFNYSPDIVKNQFGAVRDKAYPPAMYNAEIRFTDDQIDRLLNHLRQKGLYDNTAIIVVADHGESLGEHDIYFDHFGTFEESFHIPLIMRIPGMPAGLRVDKPVTHVDLVPTICHLFGITMKQEKLMHGLVLVNLLLGKVDSEAARRETFIHEDAHNRMIMVRQGPWKLTTLIRPVDRPVPELMLYDLKKDPQELDNVADQHPDIVQDLSKYFEPWIKLGNPYPKVEGKPPMDPSMRKHLETLGYLQSEEEGEEAVKADRLASSLSLDDYYRAVEKVTPALSDKQKADIIEFVRQAKKNLRDANTAGDTEKSKKIRQESRLGVRAMLNDEQRKSLNEILEKLSKSAAKSDDP